MSRRSIFGLTLALTVPIIACSDDDDPGIVDPPATLPATVVDVAASSAEFTTLVGALQSAGLVETLQGDGPFTVFAPTNAAFDALGTVALDKVTGDQDLLAEVLTYHVVPGSVAATDVVSLSSAVTVNGKELSISVEAGEVFVDGARVTTTDLFAQNGVVHVIDGVLLPEPVLDIVETAENAGSFATLLTAVDVAGLTETLKGEGPFTVLAPTDDAFAKIPAETLDALLEDIPALTDVLTYHVIDGEVPAETVVTLDRAMTLQGTDVSIAVAGDGSVTINDANVVITDIKTTNGVIHVLDTVLIPDA